MPRIVAFAVGEQRVECFIVGRFRADQIQSFSGAIGNQQGMRKRPPDAVYAGIGGKHQGSFFVDLVMLPDVQVLDLPAPGPGQIRQPLGQLATSRPRSAIRGAPGDAEDRGAVL